MRPIDADAIPKEFLEYEFDGKWNGCTIKDLIDELPTIQHEKAQLSQEGTTSDLISRQAALEIKFSNGIIRRGVAYVRVDELVNKLKALPTIQPEPQWIPVSERLPETEERSECDEYEY